MGVLVLLSGSAQPYAAYLHRWQAPTMSILYRPGIQDKMGDSYFRNVRCQPLEQARTLRLGDGCGALSHHTPAHI